MNGLLVIDKPAGLTSHDVISRVRYTLHERRIGHTGTLDPFATGVLLVLVGRSTRLAQFLSGDDKQYEAIIRLGYATTTGDRTGDPLSPPGQTTRNWSEDEIESAMMHVVDGSLGNSIPGFLQSAFGNWQSAIS